MLNYLIDDVLYSLLPSNFHIKERIEKSTFEVNMVVYHMSSINMIKIFNINGINENNILEFYEDQSLLLENCSSFVYPSKVLQLNNDNENVIISRDYYQRDLEEIIQSQSLLSDDVCSIMCSICDILIILSEYNVMINNFKSSNIICEVNNDIKLCDLFLNELRREEDVKLYDICIKSPEELNGLECDDKSVIWSIGCILYEMISKKLPFNKDDNIAKTLNNIQSCKYSIDIKCDDMMKEMIFRMLKMKSKDRLGLKELRKEMIKMSGELIESHKNYMICKDRKEVVFNNDFFVEISPFTDFQLKYYIHNDKWEMIRDVLINSYNNEPNERILSILMMMKLFNKRYGKDRIEKSLKFQIHHQCVKGKGCFLDEMIFNVKNIIIIRSDCICLCKEGMNYVFNIIKLINPVVVSFSINIPLKCQSLFGSYFSQLANLQELNLYNCSFTFHFIEEFVKSIPLMKLKFVNLENNPIGVKGFKMLLPNLQLLINKDSILYLSGMCLNDESMILLSEELYKYPNLQKIYIAKNKNIHSRGLKALISKFPISRIVFDFNRSNKELLIDKSIPHLIKFNEYLNLNNLEIDDDFFKSLISIRSNELREIRCLYLGNNILTYKGIEMLINNLSSFSNLYYLQLNGNKIEDEGMKILSPYAHLLRGDCSKMGLSSIGLKYIIDGLKNNSEEFYSLDIRDNNIDSEGIEYLMNFVKKNKKNFSVLWIENNPIGNIRFKLLLDNIDMLRYDVLGSDYSLSKISIDDESVKILSNVIDNDYNWNIIYLNGNNIRMDGLKAICEKSLEYNCVSVVMNNSSWNDEELKYYLRYCTKKYNRNCNLSNMNINDSHISLIKQIKYERLDLSNNRISDRGLKELTDSLPKYYRYISVCNNPIGDEGIEIICKYLDRFIKIDNDSNRSSLNLSNVGMNEKGLKMLIDRLRDYEPLEKIDLLGNEVNEEELRLMKEKKETFESLYELSITVKEDIDKRELESFLQTFSSIETIKLDGISEEGRKELSNNYLNIE